jgi:hypothetical protein
MARFIAGMGKKQAAQQRVGGQFGSADQIPAPFGLDLGKLQQFLRAPAWIGPDGPVERTQKQRHGLLRDAPPPWA